MSNAFDPYYTWLGISPAEQPPNHYRLLGIPLFEGNADVISNAADRQMAHIRTFQSGKYSAESQKILNELSAARVVLLDAKKREAYDAQLRTSLYPTGTYAGAGMVPPQGQMPMQGQVPMQGQMPMQGQVPMQGQMPMQGQVPMQGQMPMQGQVPMQGQMPMQGQVPMGMPPQPPVPAPPTIGSSRSSSKKYRKQKDDLTKYYVIGGGLALLAILGVFFLSSGKKEPVQTADVTQTEDANSGISFDSTFDEAEIMPPEPDRPVQENVMQDDSSAKPKADTSKPADSAKLTPAAEDGEDSEDSETAESEKEAKDASDSAEDGEEKTETDEESEEAETKVKSKDSKDKKKAGKSSKSEDEEAEEEDEDSKDGEAGSKGKRKKKSGEKEESEDEDGEDSSEVTEKDILKLGQGTSLHLEPARSKMLKFYGAEKQHLEAVASSVEWLMDKQLTQKNSAWWCFDHSLLPKNKKRHGDFENPGLARENLMSATTLALMAVVTQGEFTTKEVTELSKVVNFLQQVALPASDQQVLPANFEEVKRQEATLAIEQKQIKGTYPHAWGTIAVCDFLAYLKASKDKKAKYIPQIEEFAMALLRHLCNQQLRDGGFPTEERTLSVDYVLKDSSALGDVVATVWNLMAMRAADEAGLAVPKDNIFRANEFLEKKIKTLKTQTKNFTQVSRAQGWQIRTAFLGIQLMGKELPEYEDTLNFAQHLLSNFDETQLETNFFTTLLMRDLRGEVWESWKEKALKKYLKDQETSKDEKGSWYYDGDQISMDGGRMYCTAMTLLILESLYRYEPLRPLDEYELWKAQVEAEAAAEVEPPENGEAFALSRPGEEGEADSEKKEEAEAPEENAPAAFEVSDDFLKVEEEDE